MTLPSRHNKLNKEEYLEYLTLKELVYTYTHSIHPEKMELLTHYMIRHEQFGHEF